MKEKITFYWLRNIIRTFICWVVHISWGQQKGTRLSSLSMNRLVFFLMNWLVVLSMKCVWRFSVIVFMIYRNDAVCGCWRSYRAAELRSEHNCCPGDSAAEALLAELQKRNPHMTARLVFVRRGVWETEFSACLGLQRIPDVKMKQHANCAWLR